MSKTVCGAGKKVLASALSAAMVVAFAPAVAMAAEDELGGGTPSSASTEVEQTAQSEGAAGQEAKTLPTASQDGTITISQSGTYKLSENVTADIVINSNVDVTIDLNGKTITNYSADTLSIELGSTLTVIGSGTVDNVTHGKAAVYNNGTVALKGGSFTRSKEAGTDKDNSGGNSYYNVLNHGVMTIADGVEIAQYGRYSSLIANGYYDYSGGSNERSNYVQGTNQSAPSLIITGGSFSGGLNTIKNDDNGVLNITGGKFTNYTQAALQNHGTATVSAGEFSAESMYSIDNWGVNSPYDPGKLTITGGMFNGVLNVVAPYVDVSISGGTFSDIAGAVKYAANGATLKMGAKATSTLAIARGKDITLDLNGNDIEVSQGDAIVNKGKLKVVGNGVVKAAKSGCAAVANFPGANAVLTGGTYKSDSWYAVKNLGAMEIDGAVTVTTDNQTNNSSLIDNGWYDTTDSVAGESVQAQKDAAKLVIKSGDFKGSSGPKSCSVVKNDDYGVLEIAGGTFDSTTNNNEENAATLLNWNVAKVTGGVFRGKYPIANGSYGADSADKGVVEISGGTFVGSQTLFGCNGGAMSGEGKVSISAGTFSAPSLVGEGTKLPYDVAITAGTFSSDASAYMDKDTCYEYKMKDGKIFIVQSKDAAAPANSAGYNTWGAADANGIRSEEYVAPAAPVIPTPTPKPEPAPEPTPAAPGTAVSGTDNAGNKVDATVTDNTATTLPDGTTAAGSVEYKGSEATGSTAPTTEVSVPSTVTTSDGSTYVVTKIADSAFEGQEQLNKVTIPETVVEIGDKAFAGTSIEEVKIPAATTTIGNGVFQGCESLKAIDLSESAITEVPADAFNGTALKAVEIPATVITIGARAFKGTALKSVSTDAATVARSAFAGCESLKSASMPKATEIGKYAFNGAAKLKSLATGKKLEVIGYKALAGTKVGTLTVRSKKLTKGSVKGSLKGSNVKKVVVDVSGSKKTVAKIVEKYKKFFTKKNCGKSVKVVAKKK